MPNRDRWAKAPDHRADPRLHAAVEEESAADRFWHLAARFTPLACGACGTRVLVRKNSLAQTSVQWLSDAARSCPRFAARAADGAPGGTAQLQSCPDLRDSIDRAVREGVLEVPDHDG